MEALFLSAFGIGLTFSAVPGVITVEAIRRGMARGIRPALSLEFGSLIGDATWALIALIGLAFLFQNQLVTLALSCFGCFLMLRLAWSAFQSAQKTFAFDTPQLNTKGDFAAGAALSLSNPQNLTFWLGMGSTVIGLGFLNPKPEHLVVFFMGYMAACTFWCFFFAGLVNWGRKWINQRFFRWINLLCALFLTYLAINLLAGALQLALQSLAG
jgi:chemosensory pili system protein ChpE